MATFITKEIDLSALHAGIFVSEADLISPVVVQEEKRPYVIQTLGSAGIVISRHCNLWASFAAPGIGYYSLSSGNPAGVLARVDSYFRTPNEEEMKQDLHEFGEQVVGPAVSEIPEEQREQYDRRGRLRFFGETYYFEGPPRIRKTLFLTRVFPGALPSDISALIHDIETISQPDEMMSTQGYHLFHSTDGQIKYLPFKNVEDYAQSKLTDFGQMRMDQDRLLFYPADGQTPTDLTQHLLR